jgi:uncharacterized protein (DUF488 family)
MQNPIYSIGHGTRKADDFLSLLQAHNIAFLCDVRSVPHSRFNPQYRQQALKAFLEGNGITYVFMGDALGGRPIDPGCYTNGKVDYVKISKTGFFRQGIERLKDAYAQNLKLAIMCSESKPLECHRTHLISKVLDDEGIKVSHIDEKGSLVTHRELLAKARKNSGFFDI